MISPRYLLHQDWLWLRTRQIHLSCLLYKKTEKPNQPPQEVLDELLENATVGNRQRVSDDRWLRSAYTEANKRDQAAKALRPKTDPQETSVILFPGQGVQYVGMSKELLRLPQVKGMYKDASEILGYDLLKLCLNGPQNELDLTKYCQPAVYVASLAALALMIEEQQTSVESCVATAGFSVGEYAALVLANSLSFHTGLKLVKERAELMHEASENVQGGMMTLFLDPAAKIGTILNNTLEWCMRKGVENPVCSVANYMFPNCRVLAGNVEALKFIEENSQSLKIRKCKRVPVSGAFHTALMKPAAQKFSETLRKCNMRDPEISVHSNVDGLPYVNAEDIKRKLVKQIYLPVKWEQTLRVLYDRDKGVLFPKTFEVGPGKSLTTLLRSVNLNAAKESCNIRA